MATPRSFDEKRARIAALTSEAPPTAVTELRRFLADKSGYLVGDAARATGELGLRDLIPDLAAAFMRLLDDAVTSDKGCHGKNRIVEALLALDADEPDVYLAGVHHRQLEPAWKSAIDTAVGLRGVCAHALFHVSHRTALLEVTPLLADPEPVARLEAANALGGSGLDAAAAVLHLKALAGDKEPEVVGGCYRGLLRLLPARYLTFVALALQSEQEGEAEAAAFALGESRAPGALEALKKALAFDRGQGVAESVMLGIALCRSDDGNGFLASLVESGEVPQAAAALSALALHRHDEALVARIRGVVEGRGSRKLGAIFAERFGEK